MSLRTKDAERMAVSFRPVPCSHSELIARGWRFAPRPTELDQEQFVQAISDLFVLGYLDWCVRRESRGALFVYVRPRPSVQKLRFSSTYDKITNPVFLSKRDFRFNMVMTKYENRWLRKLAEQDGISASDFVRQCIRKTWRQSELARRSRE